MASFSQSSKSMTSCITVALASRLANTIRLSNSGRVFTLPRRRIYVSMTGFNHTHDLLANLAKPGIDLVMSVSNGKKAKHGHAAIVGGIVLSTVLS